MSDQVLEMAKKSYHAYGEVTEFKNFQGNPMPEWDDLSEMIQEAWKAAATVNSMFVAWDGNTAWKQGFDDRETKILENAVVYALDPFGDVGHAQKLVIAKLVRALYAHMPSPEPELGSNPS